MELARCHLQRPQLSVTGGCGSIEARQMPWAEKGACCLIYPQHFPGEPSMIGAEGRTQLIREDAECLEAGDLNERKLPTRTFISKAGGDL